MSPPTLTGHLYLRDHKVLVVDDEPLNLEVFDYNFGTDFALLTASDADEAMEILAREQVAVVVADHRMPGMTGLDLLSWIAQNRPDIVRILLTAHTHVDLLLEAVNRGTLFRYIPKPWDADGMRQDLMLAIQRHILDRDNGSLRQEAQTITRLHGSGLLAASLAEHLEAPVRALRESTDRVSAHAGGTAADLACAARDAAEALAGLEALVADMRARSGAAAEDHEPVDLRDVATAVIARLRGRIEETHAELEIACAPDLPRVRGHRFQLEEALSALVRNALESMGGAEGSVLAVEADLAPDGAVRVAVRDSGGGFPDAPDRLFAPFSTTRPGAAGLGLAVVRAVAASHGARVSVDSVPHQGTRISLLFSPLPL